MEVFDTILKGYLLNPNILAEPLDATFFFRGRLLEKALHELEALVVGTLDSVPAIGIVQWVFDRTISHIEERQLYYQNIILYYLETNDAQSLGFKETDVARIRSSIFESWITWWKFWESYGAKRNWMEFGNKEFARVQEDSAKRIALNTAQFDEIISKLNFAFVGTRVGESYLIYNSWKPANLLSSKMSIGYDFAHPRKLFVTRVAFDLLQIGLKFAPVPGPSKSAFNKMINSMYREQVRSEGALFAYADHAGMNDVAQNVVLQSVNPFLIHDLSGQIITPASSSLDFEKVNIKF
jgi:hypothetical protein